MQDARLLLLEVVVVDYLLSVLTVVGATVLVFLDATWVQAVHAFKSRNDTAAMRGISVFSLALASWSTTAWFVYGVRQGLVASYLNSVLVLASVFVIAACVVYAKQMKASTMWLWVLAMLAFAAFWSFVDTTVIGVAATAVGMFFLFPQMVKTVRSVGTSEIDGYGNSAIAMILFANTLWVAYGVFKSDLWITVSSSMHLFGGLVMLASKVADRVVAKRKVNAPSIERERAGALA